MNIIHDLVKFKLNKEDVFSNIEKHKDKLITDYEYEWSIFKSNNPNKNIYSFYMLDFYGVIQFYYCSKSNAVGITYLINKTYLLHPFIIVNHDWEMYKDQNESVVKISGHHYFKLECKKCKQVGVRQYGANKQEIYPVGNFYDVKILYTCEELILKNLL